MADEYDRPPFDVYGTLLVLSFLMTLGAVLILNQDLSTSYGFQLFGDKPKDQKWHNTQYRDLSKKYDTNAPFVEVRKEDLDEWQSINGSKAQFPIKKESYEWPADYRVDQYPVDPRVDNLWKKANEPGNEKLKEALEKLMAAAPPAEEPKKVEEKKTGDEAKPPETPKPPEAPKDTKPPENK